MAKPDRVVAFAFGDQGEHDAFAVAELFKGMLAAGAGE